jgi:DNA topoisomerase I
MVKYLVIVESPGKIKKIEAILGKDYIVRPSFGHITNLDPKTLSIDTNTMIPKYYVDKGKNKVIKELKELSKKYEVILASDNDTEGEAIAFHLTNVLKLKNPKRIIFTEITKKAIQEAIANPTTINYDKVNNQQGRRVIDRLVGYLLSPILWKSLSSNYKKDEAISVGRVQSVLLKILHDKDEDINKFSTSKCFNVLVNLDDNISTKLKETITDKKYVERIIEKGEKNGFILTNINKKELKNNPKPPYITSTLQQEANVKFGFSSKSTMMFAQKLYEAGLITYMRTDSTNLSEDILQEIKEYILENFSDKYYHKNIYCKKSKNNTQEAHEAIRPTKITFDSSNIADANERKLYELIWKRTVASQMSSYVYDETTYNFQIYDYDKYNFISKYNVVVFDGFKKVYNPKEVKDTNEEEDKVYEGKLKIKKNDKLEMESLNAFEKYKSPPCRYTEGSLIKKLDTIGIGRPSTFCAMLSAIMTKKYALIGDKEGEKMEVIEIKYKTKDKKILEKKKEIIYGGDKKKIIMTSLGQLVNTFIEKNFSNLINYEFTKEMEEQLDLIEKGKIDWIKVTKHYYKNIMDTISNHTSFQQPMTELGHHKGHQIVKYCGKYGPVVREDLGVDETGKNQYKYSDISTEFEKITLEDAIRLLKYPYVIFNYKHKPVEICKGQYGLYFKYDGKNHSLKNHNEEELDKTVIKEIIKNSSNSTTSVINKLNDSVSIMNGPYGAYIKTLKKNYKIPAGYNTNKITLEDCKEIIANIPKKVYKKRN